MMALNQAVTIVMIEDDDGHARLIEKNIRRAGVSNMIVHLKDGTSALDFLFGTESGGRRCEHLPVMILLDLNLPDMSGIDILKRVKADQGFRRAPVIVLTTTDDETEIDRCYDLGCNVLRDETTDLSEICRVDPRARLVSVRDADSRAGLM